MTLTQLFSMQMFLTLLYFKIQKGLYRQSGGYDTPVSLRLGYLASNGKLQV